MRPPVETSSRLLGCASGTFAVVTANQTNEADCLSRSYANIVQRRNGVASNLPICWEFEAVRQAKTHSHSLFLSYELDQEPRSNLKRRINLRARPDSAW